MERKWISRKEAEKIWPSKYKKPKKSDPLTCISDLPKDLEKRLIKEWKQYVGIK